MPERNHLIDLARVCSILIVVVFHTTLWQIQVVDGQLRVFPTAAGAGFWAASWFFGIVGVFFVASGFANAIMVDRARLAGEGLADFLMRRAGRLIGPMLLVTAVFIAVSTLAAWSGYAAAALSRQFAQLLWFAVVFQILLGLAPVAVALHDRLGPWVMVFLLLATGAVDAVSRLGGRANLQWLGLATVWPLAHQLGIAYQRGWFRRWSASILVAIIATCATLIAVLIFALGYPASAVAWADIPVANMLPPTLAIAVLAVAQTAALGLVERTGIDRRLPEGLTKAIAAVNPASISIYLWHIPAIVMASAILACLALLIPGTAAWATSGWLLVIAVLGLLLLGIPAISRLEKRLMPKVDLTRPASGWVVAGYWLFTVGVFAIWQAGAVLHPGEIWSSGAVITFGLGVAAFWWSLGHQSEAESTFPATT